MGRGLSQSALFVVVFLACLVEAVEALTIVLAAGMARGWRSAITGCLAGLFLLAVIVAVAGPATSAIPLDGLRLVVGGLLLIFGLQWLRKAVLRASGNKAFHDEALVFASTGARWPGGDAALLVIIPAVAGYSVVLTAVFRRRSLVDAAHAGALS
jgi:uncharacterized membrane protein